MNKAFLKVSVGLAITHIVSQLFAVYLCSAFGYTYGTENYGNMLLGMACITTTVYFIVLVPILAAAEK